MKMWYSGADGKDVPIEIIEGSPIVLRYYGEVKFGRFLKLESVGHGRWKHTVMHAQTPAGEVFTGPVFWFNPVVTAEDKAQFELLLGSVYHGPQNTLSRTP